MKVKMNINKIFTIISAAAIIVSICLSTAFTATATDYYDSDGLSRFIQEINGEEVYVIDEGDELQFSASVEKKIINNGTIRFIYSLTSFTAKDIVNNGVISTKYDLTINADRIENYGDIALDNNVTINADEIVNNGYIYTRRSGEPYTINSETYTGNEIVKKNQVGNSGTSMSDTTKVNANLKAIPAPQYSVTIPTSIDFGDVEKTLASADDKYATTDFDVTATTSNLFVNEKKIVVTIASNFQIANGENKIEFSVFKKSDTTFANPFATADEIMNILPTQTDTGANATENYTARLDQSKIKAAGDYNGTVTFTVALQDK